jgi:hypothetical protein
MVVGYASPTVGIQHRERSFQLKTVGQGQHPLILLLDTQVKEQAIDTVGTRGKRLFTLNITRQNEEGQHHARHDKNPTRHSVHHQKLFVFNGAKLQNKSETQGKSTIFPQRNG